jgi:hypothetical protein
MLLLQSTRFSAYVRQEHDVAAAEHQLSTSSAAKASSGAYVLASAASSTSIMSSLLLKLELSNLCRIGIGGCEVSL